MAAKIADGTVTRGELFITSKLTQAHHEPGLVEPALRRSLANLGMEYVDLWLIHAPYGVSRQHTTHWRRLSTHPCALSPVPAR